jgi:hypothetical protein
MSMIHPTRAAPANELNPDIVAGDDVACAVCPHPWQLHDRISARFCTATVAGQFSRGCVCTAYPDKETR